MSDLVGAMATFTFQTRPDITGIIKHAPQATGDCFVVDVDGVTFHIQQFDWLRIDVARPHPDF